MNENGLPDLVQAARRLLAESDYLTLATQGPEGPWAAAVYHVVWGECCYFLSSERARHIRQALAGGGVAAAVSRSGEGWRDICGLQMTGRVELVQDVGEWLRAARLYLVRHATARDLVRMGTFRRRLGDPAGGRIRLYRLRVDEARYTDNRVGLGLRVAVALTDPSPRSGGDGR